MRRMWRENEQFLSFNDVTTLPTFIPEQIHRKGRQITRFHIAGN
jgi:hypothetical protein